MAIKLSGLSSQNPWWKQERWEEEDRDFKKIKYVLNRKKIDLKKGEIYLIRGVRRAGKTVYTKLIIEKLLKNVDNKKIIYISCDRHTIGEIKNIIETFKQRFAGEVAIFDEITYHNNWNILLKELAETTDLTIIATGSNPVKIRAKKERLPGRKVEGNEYFLNPLSFREYIENIIKLKNNIENPDIKKFANKIRKTESFSAIKPDVKDAMPYFDEFEYLFYSYLITGGFPDAVIEYLNKQRINEKTYEMMIRLFLGALSKGSKSEDIGRQIMEKILKSMGSRLDFVNIASDIGVHHNTVKEYIELLENSRLIYLLPAWDINKKRYFIRKQKKIIFQSSLIPQALNQYLTGCSYDDTLDFLDKNLENIVDHTVSSHIIQSYEIPVIKERHSFAGFYYENKECDLVIRKNDKFYGFEVKYGKLKKAKYPFPVYYITKDTIDENVYPASLFLSGIKKSSHTI